jgi:hypothetical protein
MKITLVIAAVALLTAACKQEVKKSNTDKIAECGAISAKYIKEDIQPTRSQVEQCSEIWKKM